MIVGALEYRHQRYLDFLLEESPEAGLESVTHIFNKLQQWLEEYAPHGCMSMNAMAAFPDNALISQAVTQHKEQVRLLIGKQSQREDLATPLFYFMKAYQARGQFWAKKQWHRHRIW